MKSIIIITTLLLFSAISVGQSLIDTNKTWKVVENANWGASITNTYQFEGDTNINNLTYQKLFVAADSACTDWQLHTVMRENASGKVYRYSDYTGEELVYDFELQENDTFEGSYYGAPIELTVDSVDMITLENGEVRKRMILTSNFYSGEEIWIEGVGSLNGLDFVGYNMMTADHWYELNCYTENDTLKYDNPNYESCFYTTVGMDETVSNHEFSVSPNPFKQQLIVDIDSHDNKVFDIKLINPQGIVVLEKLSVRTGKHILTVQSLEKGIYLLQLYGNGGLVATKKLIKN
ncbi:MAG: T9SS type A sorting domain-containing protein [Bacteroidales bacterium]|nr:T9SS type A sorting domain-containing protein [Bacteroidales bacterium]MCF8338184.1 T9SS type A sorting domain-containing protein [Bacteroidales bacterium]